MKSQVNGKSGSRSSGNLARRGGPSARRELVTDVVVGPWTVLMSEPFTGVAVHEHAGHLLVELRSTEESVQMQLTRHDLPVVLKTLIDAVAQLAALAE